MVHPLEGLFAMLVARGVPAGLLGLGGGALRVRQIGRKLHTEPYGPEQKCTNLGDLGPAHSPAPDVGLWRGSIQLKGHCFFIHSDNRTSYNELQLRVSILFKLLKCK